DKSIVAFPEFLGRGYQGSAGLTHCIFPEVYLLFTFGGEGEDDLAAILQVCQLSLHSGTQRLLQKKMKDKIIVAKEKTCQLLRSSIGPESQGRIEAGGAFQVLHSQISPYFTCVHILNFKLLKKNNLRKLAKTQNRMLTFKNYMAEKTSPFY